MPDRFIRLGEAFKKPEPPPPPPASDELLRQVAEQLAALRADIGNALNRQPPPPPEVVVEQPDFSELVSAVASLKGGNISPADIADALAERLAAATGGSDDQLVALVSKIDTLIERQQSAMQAAARSYGGAGPTTLETDPDRELGKARLLNALGSDTINPATNDVLEQVRDTLLRRTDPIAAGTNSIGTVGLNAGTNIVGYFSSTVSKKVGEAKFYLAGARVPISLVGQRALFRMSNPAGSGKTIYIVKFTMYSDQSARVRYNEDGTLPGSPSSVTPRNIVLHAADASVANFTWVADANLPTGGTTFDNESRITPNAPLNLEFPPLVLAAGKSLVVFSEALASTGDFIGNAYYYEE